MVLSFGPIVKAEAGQSPPPWIVRYLMSHGGIGPTGPAPPVPKLDFSRLKSVALTTQSPVKSARLSYPDCGTGQPDLPNVFFKMAKSVALTTLSLLASPALWRPISVL